ncbi:MAG: TaqI-like C-terminal specificity domain-containing protein, partial [Anaerolineae bacterium]
RAAYGEPLRRYLKQQHIVEIIDFGDLPVFQQATTYPCIIILRKAPPADTFAVTRVKTLDFASLEEYVRQNRYEVARDSLSDEGWSLAGGRVQALLAKLRTVGVPLGEYVGGKIYRGVLTGLNEAFVIDERTRNRLIAEDPRSAELIKPFLLGRDVKRYEPLQSKRYLIFTRRGVNIDEYPAIKRYLLTFKERLMPRPEGWTGEEWKGRKPGRYEWYEIQDTVDYYAEFEKPKIIAPSIVSLATFAFDIGVFYSNDKTSVVGTDDLYLLGVLNSRVCDFVLRETASTKQGGFFEQKPMYLSPLPIRVLNLEDPAERAMHDRMVALVEEMLRLKREHAEAEAALEDRRHDLARAIERTDREIDRLVYQLYGLTEDEIAIVEGQSPA